MCMYCLAGVILCILVISMKHLCNVMQCQKKYLVVQMKRPHYIIHNFSVILLNRK